MTDEEASKFVSPLIDGISPGLPAEKAVKLDQLNYKEKDVEEELSWQILDLDNDNGSISGSDQQEVVDKEPLEKNFASSVDSSRYNEL